MPDLVLDLQNVKKTYGGKIQALRGVSMAVERGSIFGLLGPNGAGKSTLVKILMTVIRATECHGTMLGVPVGNKAALLRVGYLPEHHRFPDYLTGGQVLDFFGAMGGIDRTTRKRRAGELLDLVGMGTWANHRIRQYSKGMRQRIGIAQALMNDPDFVILDEPTDGVDPVGRRDIRNVLIEQKRRGRTVMLNSHLLSELEMLCDRAAVMVQGKVTNQGTIEELTSYGSRYEIDVSRPAGETQALAVDSTNLAIALGQHFTLLDAMVSPRAQWQPANPERLVRGGKLNGFADVPVELDGSGIKVGTDDAAVVQPILDSIRASGLYIKAARPVRPTLEDLFMRAVTDPTTGAVSGPGAIDFSKNRPNAAPPTQPTTGAQQ